MSAATRAVKQPDGVSPSKGTAVSAALATKERRNERHPKDSADLKQLAFKRQKVLDLGFWTFVCYASGR
ncbi:hypothetical protein WKK05_29080 [Nostoc sp. UHCC 0302]|uniref:hypothetical protein n=1 Tax=Nostoc sp. UHCC 0302 TaxID=3134896 RepID=UPI00311CBB40